MKKILCLLFLASLTRSAFAAHVPGMINWGPYINCEAYNNSHKAFRIIKTIYNVQFTNGFQKNYVYKCVNNCTVRPHEFKRFSGPTNSPYVLRATCSFVTKRRGHHNPHPRPH
jgi:hypothetical protein